MREIKFRAWAVEHREMYMVRNLNNLSREPLDDIEIWRNDASGRSIFLNSHFEGGKFELMQYTGLKDRNGKEIFEGDVLKSEHCVLPHNHLVEERKCCMYQETVELEIDAYFSGFKLGLDASQFEAIGNIYENRELLEQTA